MLLLKQLLLVGNAAAVCAVTAFGPDAAGDAVAAIGPAAAAAAFGAAVAFGAVCCYWRFYCWLCCCWKPERYRDLYLIAGA
jgi:hypothetical protein